MSDELKPRLVAEGGFFGVSTRHMTPYDDETLRGLVRRDILAQLSGSSRSHLDPSVELPFGYVVPTDAGWIFRFYDLDDPELYAVGAKTFVDRRDPSQPLLSALLRRNLFKLWWDKGAAAVVFDRDAPAYAELLVAEWP